MIVLSTLVVMGTIMAICCVLMWKIVTEPRKEVRQQRAHNLRIAADTMRILGETDKAAEYERRANALDGSS